jgi:hypothetical protein
MEGTVVNQDGPLMNTMHAFAQAQAQGHGYTLLLPGEEVPDLEITPDSRQHILRDLEHGFAVLVPDAEAGLSMLGWWRVNPETGETLGMLSDGRGSVVTEYLIKFSGAVSKAFLAVGLFGCIKNASSQSRASTACCIGTNFLFYGIGWLGGNVIGPASSSYKMSMEIGGSAALRAKAYIAYSGALFDSVSAHVSICN